MGRIKISDAAALLSVSDDTVRRWVEQERLTDLRDDAGAHVVDGTELAAMLVDSGRELERQVAKVSVPATPVPPDGVDPLGTTVLLGSTIGC